uniref:glycosyltransferase family 4 protein n=1 Tax=Algoriphagus sp. TaxID=1872435 RepID=UPI004048BAED
MSNILIITPYFRPAELGGGGQISVENLADTLKYEHSVTVICYNHDFGKRQNISKEYIINENRLKIYLYSFINFNTIRKEISSVYFSHIYFNSFFSPICLLFQLFFLNRKKIISPKGEFYDAALKKKKLLKKTILLLYKLCRIQHIFHSTSFHEVEYIKKHFPLSKIEIARDIPFINNKNTIGSVRIRKSENEPFKIIYSSRIEPKKNLSFLPQLLKNLKGNVQFDIYGDISDKHYFEQVLYDLKALPCNILWNYCGRLNFNEARNIFFGYDLFVFPTLGENFGYVICESFQCGCPVLLSKNTTPWEDLEDAGIGYNIDLQDPNIWIDKINYFQKIFNEEKIKISKLCMNYVEDKLKITNIIIENKEIFKSI